MTERAVVETIRICRDRNVLKEYLERREKEVVTIMKRLFDEEEIMKIYIKSEKHDEALATAERLLKTGKLSLEEIVACVPLVSFDEVKEMETEAAQFV